MGLNPEGFARFEKIEENIMKIFLSSPAWAIAPGQPVAFYIGERLIGGGILTK
ncbi:MAG: hypothetical protein LIO65_10600 [Odoribacter sp.]|nr:hypothetical protein [Odoribacter sp.]